MHPVNFERTDKPDADLRVILATPTLTDKLCLPLDTGGEVSCRVDDRVVLNAKRWMYAVPAYAGQIDLYRSYLVNHEVGHALGPRPLHLRQAEHPGAGDDAADQGPRRLPAQRLADDQGHLTPPP